MSYSAYACYGGASNTAPSHMSHGNRTPSTSLCLSMPRYFFHVRGPEGRVADDTGIVFNTLEEAIEDARRARGEMLADAAMERASRSATAFEITDDDGRVLATVPLLDL